MKRRTALGLIGAAPLMSVVPAGKQPRAAVALDPNDPDDLYLIHRKVNYSYDERPVYWFIEAVRYGLVESQFTPFWKMHVAFIFKLRDTGERAFEAKNLSGIFYSDLETGELLETFDNPYTGEKLSVRQPGVNRSTIQFDQHGQVRNPQSRPGARVSSGAAHGPAWIIGDDVWVNSDTWFRSEPTGEEGRLIQVNDWSTYHASLQDVADPDVASAPATMNFNDINTFPGWLNMGNRPGNYVSRGFGNKSHSVEGMPPAWRHAMKERYPDIADDPAGAIEG